MDYAATVAWRYLRAKRRASVSVIGTIAVIGIMLGVGVLSAVLAVTSGFQAAFREKVLGVNAHLLVLKYGWDFTEYREVITRVKATPGVLGAAPFLINTMMVTHGDRNAGVLVKGVDPNLLGEVLDLPTYLVQGSISGLRRTGAQPPAAPGEDPSARGDQTLDDYLRRSRTEVRSLRESDPLGRRLHEPAARDDEPATDDDLDDDAPPTIVNQPAPAATNAAPAAATVAPGRPPLAAPLPAGATPRYAPAPDDDDPLDAISRDIRVQAEAEAARHAQSLPGAILGKTLATTLGVHVGDQVRIISPLTGADAALVRHGTSPRALDFRVVGIFDAGFDEYDSRLVYVDLWEAQRFFEQGDAVTGVEVKVRDIERASAIGRRIERELGGGPYHTLDWESLNRNLFTALWLQKMALSIVITIIIIVAAFNVVATLVMVVLDKRREVAILKAMGADGPGILRIFLIQGLVIGGAGTALGLLLGAVICAGLTIWHFPLNPQVYLIRFVPVRASPFEFAITAFVAMQITLGASLIPAAWAARLAPIEGLRYE